MFRYSVNVCTVGNGTIFPIVLFFRMQLTETPVLSGAAISSTDVWPT